MTTFEILIRRFSKTGLTSKYDYSFDEYKKVLDAIEVGTKAPEELTRTYLDRCYHPVH